LEYQHHWEAEFLNDQVGYQGLLVCAIPLDNLHDIGVSPERIPANLDWFRKSPTRQVYGTTGMICQTFFDFESPSSGKYAFHVK
jgi:hypothetical protein